MGGRAGCLALVLPGITLHTGAPCAAIGARRVVVVAQTFIAYCCYITTTLCTSTSTSVFAAEPAFASGATSPLRCTSLLARSSMTGESCNLEASRGVLLAPTTLTLSVVVVVVAGGGGEFLITLCST